MSVIHESTVCLGADTQGVHTLSQAPLHKYPLGTYKKNWGQDRGPENVICVACIRRVATKQEDMKIQPDPFLT